MTALHEAPMSIVAIGSDHAGFQLKQEMALYLQQAGLNVIDVGTDSDQAADYPIFCIAVGEAVASGQVHWGIVLGGSGQGEQIAANKVRGVRAALCDQPYYAEYARLHNNANVLAIGARIVAVHFAMEIADTFRKTSFSGEERHVKRLGMITEYENEHKA
ncbi:MAG: ribose 5-phosphate isomerase B [Gemmatimonadaceae bacterium]